MKKQRQHYELELCIGANMLSRWRDELSEDGANAFQSHGKARDEYIARFKQELVRMKKERDFLQEAAAFFAKASK